MITNFITLRGDFGSRIPNVINSFSTFPYQPPASFAAICTQGQSFCKFIMSLTKLAKTQWIPILGPLEFLLAGVSPQRTFRRNPEGPHRGVQALLSAHHLCISDVETSLRSCLCCAARVFGGQMTQDGERRGEQSIAFIW